MQYCLDTKTMEVYDVASAYFIAFNTRELFARFNSKDPYLAMHSARTAMLSGILGFQLVRDQEFCQKIFVSGMLHDIGKLNMPNRILKSATKLSEEDKKTIHAHPKDGVDLAKSLGVNDETALNVVLNHHLRFDMTGYPELNNPQCLASSIVSICDAFDAMRSKRPYTQPKTLEETLSEIEKGSGTQFHPLAVQAFLELKDLLALEARKN